MKIWTLRRRALLVWALVILLVLLGIHLATDISVGGFGVSAGADADVTGEAGLPSNQRVDTAPAVPMSILGATSVLGHQAGVYLDGTAPVLN